MTTPPPRFIGLFRVHRAHHDSSAGITTIEVEFIFTPWPPPMAFCKAPVRDSFGSGFGNMHLDLADGWRLEWDST